MQYNHKKSMQSLEEKMRLEKEEFDKKCIKAINNPGKIIALLEKNHLGVIYAAINDNYRDRLSKQTNWEFCFDTDQYHDEDVEGHPFLEFLCLHVFKWCGCHTGTRGRLEALYGVFDAFYWEGKGKIDYIERNSRLHKIWGSDGAGDILMDLFGDKNLFSHGGSNHSAWLTNDGIIVYHHLVKWIEWARNNGILE